MVREVGGHSGGASGDVRSGTPLLKAMKRLRPPTPMPLNCGKSVNDSAESAWPAFAATIASKTTLCCGDHTVADALWALTSNAYLRPVHEAGWPIESSRPGSLTCYNAFPSMTGPAQSANAAV
jgi:hypothetical protein